MAPRSLRSSCKQEKKGLPLSSASSSMDKNVEKIVELQEKVKELTHELEALKKGMITKESLRDAIMELLPSIDVPKALGKKRARETRLQNDLESKSHACALHEKSRLGQDEDTVILSPTSLMSTMGHPFIIDSTSPVPFKISKDEGNDKKAKGSAENTMANNHQMEMLQKRRRLAIRKRGFSNDLHTESHVNNGDFGSPPFSPIFQSLAIDAKSIRDQLSVAANSKHRESIDINSSAMVSSISSFISRNAKSNSEMNDPE
jgi:hypothetical protein